MTVEEALVFFEGADEVVRWGARVVDDGGDFFRDRRKFVCRAFAVGHGRKGFVGVGGGGTPRCGVRRVHLQSVRRIEHRAARKSTLRRYEQIHNFFIFYESKDHQVFCGVCI